MLHPYACSQRLEVADLAPELDIVQRVLLAKRAEARERLRAAHGLLGAEWTL